MFDRIRLAWKVLVTPKIIVITKGEQFSTFDSARCVQTPSYISVEVNLKTEEKSGGQR